MDEQEIEQLEMARAEYDLMSLFEELSFREKVSKVMNGLKQPKTSGEYKYAKLQLLRLMAPISAVVVPILFMGMLMVFAELSPPVSRTVEVTVIEPEKIEELDKIEEILEEPPEPPEPIEMDFVPDETLKETINPAPTPDFSPQPAKFDAVAMVKSPVVMKNIYASRDPGARGQALVEYGGTQSTEAAVMRALRWLKKEQKPDGSWEGPSSAMASLALLAYMAHGETPASEEFGMTVEKAIQFIVGDQKENGRFKSSDNEEYTLPISAYALSEAYSLTRIPPLKYAAEKAIKPIIDGQNPNGGWTYKCQPSNARTDTSYSGWCAQALSAAASGGLEARRLDQTMAKAILGLKKNAAGDGSFEYSSNSQENGSVVPRWAMTGAAVLALQLLGAGNDKETQAGLTFMEKVSFDWNEPGFRRPIYNWYYITQAKFHAGGPGWQKWNKMFANALVKNQVVLRGAGLDGKDIGYWDDVGRLKECNLVYNTALCTLMLEVYYRYLPSYKAPKVRETEEEEPSDAEPVQADDDIDIEIVPG